MSPDARLRQLRRWTATASLACAMAAPVAILAGAVGARHGWWDIHLGLALAVRIAPVLAILGAALGVLALLAALSPPKGPAIPAVIAMVLGLATAGACGGWRAMAVRSLPVHDTAATWSDPLLFSPTLMLARGADSNPVESAPMVPYTRFDATWAGRSVAEANARACPAARPIVLPLPPAQAYARLRAAVETAGLALATDDPAPDAHGRRRLEATATGVWFGFKDDLAARLSPSGAGARIDLRVSSRIGLSDFGRGCRLIGRLRGLLGG